jgi:hypothetical protein
VGSLRDCPSQLARSGEVGLAADTESPMAERKLYPGVTHAMAVGRCFPVHPQERLKEAIVWGPDVRAWRGGGKEAN